MGIVTFGAGTVAAGGPRRTLDSTVENRPTSTADFDGTASWSDAIDT